jgi:hypothetical protein
MYLLQDWVTIGGNGTTPFVQSMSDWADLAPFGDVVLWLEVRAVTNPGAGNVTLAYETSPSTESAIFMPLASLTLSAASSPVITKVQLGTNPAVPLARWLRWNLQGTASGDWSVTFRIHCVAGNATSASDFVATSIPNCLAWYRASLGVTSASGAASAWADQSGAGDANRNLTQSTAGSQPTINTGNANFNSRATLDFDGVNDCMVSGAWSGGAPYSQPVTIYVVHRATALGSLYIFDDVGGSSRIAILDDNGGHWEPFAGAVVVGGAYNTNTTYVVGLVVNGGSSALYANQYNTAAVSGNPGSNSLASITLGARFTAVEGFYTGSMAELIAYSGAHDATTRQTVMQALGTMYGVTVTS